MFLKFDIVAFYPSINPRLLKNIIDFARSINGIFISQADENIPLHCRKGFLFLEGQPWAKTGLDSFNVQMGSFDGAEVCELISLCLLHKLTNGANALFEIDKVGLYRDDGLALIKMNQGGRTADRKMRPILK